MSIKVSIEFEGVENLMKELKRLDKEADVKIQSILKQEAEKVKNKLEAATPISDRPGPHLKHSWHAQEYHHAYYVGSTKQVPYRGGMPPLINLLEYNYRHPRFKFMSRTWESIKNDVEVSLKRNLEQAIINLK